MNSTAGRIDTGLPDIKVLKVSRVPGLRERQRPARRAQARLIEQASVKLIMAGCGADRLNEARWP